VASATISRWARRFLLVGVGFLLASQLAALFGAPRRVEVALGLNGFVLTVVFGKAYSLVPSYFDRTLVGPRSPAVHLPIHVVAVCSLAAAGLPATPSWIQSVGAVAWASGTGVFVAAIAGTVASNPLGLETGTSEASAGRAPLDRLANPFMPVALGYLLLGSYERLAGATALPGLLGGAPVRVTHLLAAGFALLLLFAVGYRLLPRFLVATVPRSLAVVALPAGAVAPALLAVGYPAGPVFVAGAALESLAVVAFAVSYGWLFASTDRDRVGFFGPLGGVVAGVAGVAIGLQFALVGLDATLALAHLRLNLFGLLGLSIVGVLYQFYPPAVVDWPAAGDRLALSSIAVYATGLAFAAAGPHTPWPLVPAGQLLVAAAALAVLYCIGGAIHVQTTRR
jgi:hypothetical protein